MKFLDQAKEGLHPGYNRGFSFGANVGLSLIYIKLIQYVDIQEISTKIFYDFFWKIFGKNFFCFYLCSTEKEIKSSLKKS